MEQQGIQLNQYLHLFWRGKWLILLTTTLALSAIVALVELRPAAPPSYSAIATLKVQPLSSPVAIEDAVPGGSPDQGLDTHAQIIASPSVLEKAMAKLNPEQAEGSATDGATEVAQLQRVINVRPIEGTDLLEVRARAYAPQPAQAMAYAVVEAYIEYVKEQRTSAVGDALRQIGPRLKEGQSTGGLRPQLTAFHPSVAFELASITQSIEGILQMVAELDRQQSSFGEETSLDREIPHIEGMTATLSVLALDLHRFQEGLAGTQHGTTTGPGDGPSSVQDSRSDRVAGDYLATLSESIKAAESLAEEARIALDLVPHELAPIQADESGVAAELAAVRAYVTLVSREIEEIRDHLQNMGTAGAGLTKDELIPLREKVLAQAGGLREVKSQVQGLRSQVSAREYSRIIASEGYTDWTISKLDQLAENLEATINSGILDVPGLNHGGGTQEGQIMSTLGSGELEEISRTLEAAAARLRGLEATVTDPLMKARLKSATMQVAAAQEEVAAASARQEVAGLEQFSSLSEGIRAAQVRVQEGANVLVDIVESLDPGRPGLGTAPPEDLQALVYADAARVASFLDAATTLLQELGRTNTASPLGGELEVITHRLVGARNEARELLSRLSPISGSGVNSGTSTRPLGIVEARLQVAAEHLEAGAQAAEEKLRYADSAGLGEAAAKLMEEADMATSILGVVADDLEGIQRTGAMPERQSQLGIVEEQVRAAQAQVRTVSSHLQQIQQGKAAGHSELPRLEVDHEGSLLNPQETEITMVEFAITIAEDDTLSAFLSKMGLPLGGLAGFLLGTMLVLVKAQMDPRTRRPDNSGHWSEW